MEKEEGRKRKREGQLLGKLSEPSLYRCHRRLSGENWAPKHPLGSQHIDSRQPPSRRWLWPPGRWPLNLKLADLSHIIATCIPKIQKVFLNIFSL